MLKRIWRWMFGNNIPAAPLLKASDEHHGPVSKKIVTIFAPPTFFRAAQVSHGGFDTMSVEE